MFILYGLLIGLLVGFGLRGRASGLAALDLRWSALVFLGLLVQIVLFSGPVTERVGELGPAIYVLSTAMVLAAVVRNWRIPGMPVVILGALCNFAAITANGGYMPAGADAVTALGRSAPTVYSNSAWTPDPALWPLTDIFALPSWLPWSNIFSVGDVLIGGGVALVVVLAMRSRPAPVAGSATAAASGGAPAR